MKGKRKRLSVTHRQITIGGKKPDISSCCRADIKMSRIYPFDLYCKECSKQIVYEDQIIFRRRLKPKPVDLGELADYIEEWMMEGGFGAHPTDVANKIRKWRPA